MICGMLYGSWNLERGFMRLILPAFLLYMFPLAADAAWFTNLFPAQASDLSMEILKFNRYVFAWGLFIWLAVLAAFCYVMFVFRESKGHEPSKVTHNVPLEVVWTIVPCLILLLIAGPSYRVLSMSESVPTNCDLTLKVVAHQWYWSYSYPDHSIDYDSYIKDDNSLQPGDKRLLSVDRPIYIPINTNVRIIITSDDVIHSWGVPSFGVKKDAVPGRLNETWVNIKVPGTYYGQCYELCGKGHGFMPIEVRAVEPSVFEKWIKSEQKV